MLFLNQMFTRVSIQGKFKDLFVTIKRVSIDYLVFGILQLI